VVSPGPTGAQLRGDKPESPPLLDPELPPELLAELPPLPPELLPEPDPLPLPDPEPLEDEDAASLPPSLFSLVLIEPPQLAEKPMATASATSPRVAWFTAP